jgi:hypothetical protein
MGISARAWPGFFAREFTATIGNAEKLLHLAH